ncbi:FadR family transcriptional regulator [candidate division KSB1 bacterium]|nr:FadR family transcriptional regulator [candidate division KSB1 bacterium]
MNKKEDSYNLRKVDRPQKLSVQIEAQLNNAIHKQVFGPGEFLPSENELAKIFGVSRNVAREALLMLSAKNLIEIIKGKGAYVVEPSINHVLDPFTKLVDFKCGKESLVHILAIRQIIEPSVAALAAQHRTENDSKKLEKCLQSMETAKGNKIEFSHHDINFHNVISRSCYNPLVPIVLEPIFHVLAKFHPPIFYNPNVIDITLEYHTKIYDAILNQQSENAFIVMKEHLKLTEEHNSQLYAIINKESHTE